MAAIPDKQKDETAPLLQNKSPEAASVFSPDALLREARRQKGLTPIDVPTICILDPDGDIVRRLQNSGRATRFSAWPCYHTDLYTFRLGGDVLGGAVTGIIAAALVRVVYWEGTRADRFITSIL